MRLAGEQRRDDEGNMLRARVYNTGVRVKVVANECGNKTTLPSSPSPRLM